MEQIIRLAKFYGLSESQLIISWYSEKIADELKYTESISEILKVAEEKINYYKAQERKNREFDDEIRKKLNLVKHDEISTENNNDDDDDEGGSNDNEEEMSKTEKKLLKKEAMEHREKYKKIKKVDPSTDPLLRFIEYSRKGEEDKLYEEGFSKSENMDGGEYTKTYIHPDFMDKKELEEDFKDEFKDEEKLDNVRKEVYAGNLTNYFERDLDFDSMENWMQKVKKQERKERQDEEKEILETPTIQSKDYSFFELLDDWM
jgi:hypothetical protein